MHVKNYLTIAARNLGAHVGTKGANLTEADYERLWSSSLDEFFAAEPISDAARGALSQLESRERRIYFTGSIFSLERFTALARDTIHTHQH